MTNCVSNDWVRYVKLKNIFYVLWVIERRAIRHFWLIYNSLELVHMIVFFMTVNCHRVVAEQSKRSVAALVVRWRRRRRDESTTKSELLVEPGLDWHDVGRLVLQEKPIYPAVEEKRVHINCGSIGLVDVAQWAGVGHSGLTRCFMVWEVAPQLLKSSSDSFEH